MRTITEIDADGIKLLHRQLLTQLAEFVYRLGHNKAATYTRIREEVGVHFNIRLNNRAIDFLYHMGRNL